MHQHHHLLHLCRRWCIVYRDRCFRDIEVGGGGENGRGKDFSMAVTEFIRPLLNGAFIGVLCVEIYPAAAYHSRNIIGGLLDRAEVAERTGSRAG